MPSREAWCGKGLCLTNSGHLPHEADPVRLDIHDIHDDPNAMRSESGCAPRGGGSLPSAREIVPSAGDCVRSAWERFRSESERARRTIWVWDWKRTHSASMRTRAASGRAQF
jgi:hypothetical protein